MDCGTGGIEISFPSIEIVSYLQKEKVYEVVRDYSIEYERLWIDQQMRATVGKFCTKHTIEEIYITKFD